MSDLSSNPTRILSMRQGDTNLTNGREKMAHASERPPKSKPTLRGKEIFEIKPIILGGSPTDPENKVILTRDQHMEVVRYWNKVVGDLRNQQTR